MLICGVRRAARPSDALRKQVLATATSPRRDSLANVRLALNAVFYVFGVIISLIGTAPCPLAFSSVVRADPTCSVRTPRSVYRDRFPPRVRKTGPVDVGPSAAIRSRYLPAVHRPHARLCVCRRDRVSRGPLLVMDDTPSESANSLCRSVLVIVFAIATYLSYAWYGLSYIPYARALAIKLWPF